MIITRIINFSFKINPFLKDNDKKILFKSIEDSIKKIEGNNKYVKLIKYYRFWVYRRWADKIRKNNRIELFHRTLNQTIEISHPKISYFIYKLKMVIINKYRDYI